MSEADESLTILAEGKEYELLSASDGAFVLRFKPERMIAHLRDDDAVRFREDYETVKAQIPDGGSDKVLAQLWDQGGYSWLAVEEEC